MPQDAYIFDRLVISMTGPAVREPGPDHDKLSLVLAFKNPIGSPGSTRRPPAMEIWDSEGRVFETTNADWAEPILPDTEINRSVRFEISPDSADLQLVLGPGEPDEVRAPIEEAA